MSSYQHLMKRFLETQNEEGPYEDFATSLKVFRYSEAQLKEELAALSKDRDDLVREHSSLVEMLEMLRKELIASNEERAWLVQALDNLRKELVDSNEERGRLVEAFEGSRKELFASNEERAGLVQALDNLRKEFVESNEERMKLVEALDVLSGRLRWYAAKWTASFQEILDLYRKLRKSKVWLIIKLFPTFRRRADRMGRAAASQITFSSELIGQSVQTMAPLWNEVSSPAEYDVANDQALIQSKEEKGLFNHGWYGSSPLDISNRYIQEPLPFAMAPKALIKYQLDTALILARFSTHSFEWINYKLCNFELIDRKLGAISQPDLKKSSSKPTFSFVSSFYAHKKFFAQLARSIAEVDAEWSDNSVEWIINNDDPSVSNTELMELIPISIQSFTHFIGGERNLGVCGGLNEGIRASRHEWVLLVDCDDLILPDALNILTHYIRTFDHCRYISSGMVDIDANNSILRYRRHDASANRIYSAGMIAGHLKAIRRDLFSEKGLLDERFNLSQDYDFALRVARDENILLIPEYLYCYRWHDKTQSSSQRAAQESRWKNVVAHHLPALLSGGADANESLSRPFLDVDRSRPVRTGAAIVRSQGSRPELFAETIASIEQQQFPVTPIVVVHGDGSTFEKVRGLCAELGSQAIVLHASAPNRLRGYPCNVGLDYVISKSEQFDFISFLDDDDIYYPNFAQQLADALEFNRADLVYSQANRREPWSEHVSGPELLPAVSLVTGNFITNSCFALRTEALRSSGVRFAEDMEYLEDWHFLISLLRTGVLFSALFETLSEFRIFSDGNTTQKRFPELFANCQEICWENGRRAAVALGLINFYDSIYTFNFNRRATIDETMIETLLAARGVFEAECFGAQE